MHPALRNRTIRLRECDGCGGHHLTFPAHRATLRFLDRVDGRRLALTWACPESGYWCDRFIGPVMLEAALIAGVLVDPDVRDAVYGPVPEAEYGGAP
jgi:hypothetical protein